MTASINYSVYQGIVQGLTALATPATSGALTDVVSGYHEALTTMDLAAASAETPLRDSRLVLATSSLEGAPLAGYLFAFKSDPATFANLILNPLEKPPLAMRIDKGLLAHRAALIGLHYAIGSEQSVHTQLYCHAYALYVHPSVATQATTYIATDIPFEIVAQFELHKILTYSIEYMKLSMRTLNCLSSANITYMGELVQESELDLLNIKNFGRKSLEEIRTELETISTREGCIVKLGMKLPHWSPPATP